MNYKKFLAVSSAVAVVAVPTLVVDSNVNADELTQAERDALVLREQITQQVQKDLQNVINSNYINNSSSQSSNALYPSNSTTNGNSLSTAPISSFSLEQSLVNFVKVETDKLLLSQNQKSNVVLTSAGFNVTVHNSDGSVHDNYVIPTETVLSIIIGSSNNSLNTPNNSGANNSNVVGQQWVNQNPWNYLNPNQFNDQPMTLAEAKQYNRFFTFEGTKYWQLDSDKLIDDKGIFSYSKSKLLEYSKDKGLNLGADTPYSIGVLSNDDTVRRSTLEKELNITLTDTPVWENGNQEIKYDIYGREIKNTSVSELKAQNNYAVNANRQEVLNKALKDNDWQPYRELSAKKTPLHFVRDAQGKLQYSKVYYAGKLNHLFARHGEAFYQGEFVKASGDSRDMNTYLKDYARELSEAVVAYKNAPGPDVYVFQFNSNDSYASQYGVKKVPNEFFVSPYNDPKVVPDGVFSK